MPPRGPQGSSCPTAGFTFLEVLITAFVLLMTIGFASMATGSSARQAQSAQEVALAHQEAENMLAMLEKRGVGTVFADFNGVTTDDGAESLGSHFDVPGLDSLSSDADGRVGRILFPVEPSAPGILREDLANLGFGLPFDLDSDGAIDAGDKSATYVLLPVRIEIEWRGRSGRSIVAVEGLLSPW